MVNKESGWYKHLIAVLCTLLPLLAIMLNFKYQFLPWANQISGVIFIEAMLLIIAFGQAYSCPTYKFTIGLLSFCLTNVALFAIGGFGVMMDAIGNGESFVGSSGIYIAFDTLSTPFTSKALEFKIIVDTIVRTIPTIVLLVAVVKIWIAANSEDTLGAVIETAIILGVLLAFGFLGNLVGFTIFEI
jgi:hypothetical protein